MANLNFDETGQPNLPAFEELPVRAGDPPLAAWGLWGENSELGMLNLLTPERVRAAAKLVQTGQVFPLNWDLELPDPPLFNRSRLRHVIYKKRDFANEDIYHDFNTQSSSQWDGFSHWGNAHYGNLYYNGVRQSEFTGLADTRNGIQAWARQGIAGRGILLDFPRWADRHQIEYNPGSSYQITRSQLEAIAGEQFVQFRPGDILIIRSGWLAWYLGLSLKEREDYALNPPYPAIGVAQGEEMLRFIWDHQFAAVAGDGIAFETWPPTPANAGLHNTLLAMWGLPIGEMFFLEDLAAHCASDGRYEFFLTSAPLNKLGGVASPPNALALK